MKILIGYDGSDTADAAIGDLERAGLPDAAEAVVITVADVRDIPTSTFLTEKISNRIERLFGRTAEEESGSLKYHLKQAETLAQTAVEKIQNIFPGWTVTAESTSGKPADELIKKADHLEPDLLVVGSHGRSALGRLVLGSVSQKVLYEAGCTLRIARRKDRDEDSFVRVLVAVDGSADADTTVKTVAGRHWKDNTEIRLVAVDDPFTHPETGYISWNAAEDKPEESEKSREWIERVIEKPAERLRSAGLNVSHIIKWGDAANMILEEAEEWAADTIFLGARGTGRLQRRLLGSVSSRVAARAHCSVEIVRS